MEISKIRQKEKYLKKKIGMAIHDYDMIHKKDRICVPVSGGKDSLTLLRLLSDKTLLYSLKFSLLAVHIETDYRCRNCMHKEVLKKIFEDWKLLYYFGKAEVLKNNKKKKITCFWCARNRRRAIFEIANKFNCNKIAFGHHKDDIIETALLNLFFNGEISTMNPRQIIFGGKFTIIRPLCYVEEKEIISYAKKMGFLNNVCACPNSEISKRKLIKDFIKEAAKVSSVVKTNIFRAPSRIKQGYLGRVPLRTKI